MSTLQNETPSKIGKRTIAKNLVTIAIVVIIAITIVLIWSKPKPGNTLGDSKVADSPEKIKEQDNDLVVSAETLTAAGIELEEIKAQPLGAFLQVTGTVEANQQSFQQASALVSGRIEKVNVVLGDYVKAGATLALIASPQIAQMHGKMHEAKTKAALAQRNLQRVERPENRIGVLSAKAKLDEAEINLRRINKLVELGAGAGKDLLAGETAYQIAKAEYEFQNNIALNREVQEAKAEVETSTVELSHIQDEMRALGVTAPEAAHVDHDHNKDTSLIPLKVTMAGSIVERLVNTGAGVEAGKPLFTLADTSTVWVIANVPEAQLSQMQVGKSAQIKAAVLGQEPLLGKIAYIDPRLKEDTRTAQVRIELANPQHKLVLGMFVEVIFPFVEIASATTVVVPESALHRLGDRTIVFVPRGDKAGHFEPRTVKVTGEAIKGYDRVEAGLKIGEKVVTKGSFALKTQMMKSELGEE